MEQYKFLDEEPSNELQIQHSEDSVVIENQGKKGKNVFQSHGISLIIFLAVIVFLIVGGSILIKLAYHTDLFIPSFFIPLIGLILLPIFFKVLISYYKAPSKFRFDLQSGSFEIVYNQPCSKVKVQSFSLDDVNNVVINKQTISASEDYIKTSYHLLVELSHQPILDIPLAEELDENGKDVYVKNLSDLISQILSTHKRKGVLVLVNDLGTKSVE